MKDSGIYIHIPFCKSKCLYCDFNSFAGMEENILPYFCALKREIKEWGGKLRGRRFDTIYFGGGTPSYAGPALLGEVIKEIFSNFDIAENCEITVECNPGTIDAEGLRTLKNSGVNRLSIGLQSTDDCALRALGRIHSFEDFEECFKTARQVGFDNISLDLMYGLPDMTMEDWKRTVEKAIGFGGEHISAYALKIEDGTPFSKMKLNLPDEDACADMYEYLVERLENMGYSRYEISNFSKKGRESRHNLKYWKLTDYLGLGAGAYSCIDNARFSNVGDVREYIENISEKGLAVAEKTELTTRERMSEFVFLGLRCARGISLFEFEERFGVGFPEVFGEPLKKYSDWGFLIVRDDRVRLSDRAFFVCNTILADFV